MKCEYQSELELFVKRQSGELPESLQEHCVSCEECAAFLDAHILNVLQQEAPAAMSTRRSEEMLFAIKHAAREEQPQGSRRKTQGSGRAGSWSRWGTLGVLAAAAAAAAPVGVMTYDRGPITSNGVASTTSETNEDASPTASSMQSAARHPRESHRPPASLAAVELAATGGHWEQVSSPPLEHVRLEDGSAWFEVEHLEEGERFVVLAGDSEVEVRGTRFRLDMENGKLVNVLLVEGTIELRRPGQPAALLRAPAEWRASTTPSLSPSLAPGPIHSSASARPTHLVQEQALNHSASVEESAEEVAGIADAAPSQHEAFDERFSQAWVSRSQGQFERAAFMFETLAAEPGIDAARHLDALYWAARAYSDAGRPMFGLVMLERIEATSSLDSRAQRLRSELEQRHARERSSLSETAAPETVGTGARTPEIDPQGTAPPATD